MTKISFLKIREVKSPERAHTFDAGIDFFVPKFTDKFIEDLNDKNLFLSKLYPRSKGIFFDSKTNKKYFIIPPQKRILIPSGIKSKMNGEIVKGEYCYALIAMNKSGIAAKFGLDVGSCVIDHNYKGEIHISLINTSDDDVIIYEDMKVVQMLETKVYTREVEVIEKTTEEDEENFYRNFIDERGEGGFGSTNKE